MFIHYGLPWWPPFFPSLWTDFQDENKDKCIKHWKRNLSDSLSPNISKHAILITAKKNSKRNVYWHFGVDLTTWQGQQGIQISAMPKSVAKIKIQFHPLLWWLSKCHLIPFSLLPIQDIGLAKWLTFSYMSKKWLTSHFVVSCFFFCFESSKRMRRFSFHFLMVFISVYFNTRDSLDVVRTTDQTSLPSICILLICI